MKILAIALLCVWAGGSVAQEERAIDNFAGVGVRAMGMGGAFVGVADDFTAMYWNPAGLAQMQQREVQVSFLRNSRANDSIFNGTAGRSELTNTRFGSLGFVYPYPVYRGSLVLAAGFNRIKDFDWNLNQKSEAEGLNEGRRYQETSDDFFQHEGELGLWGVSAAIDVSPAISLGATLGLVSGEDQATNEFNSTYTYPEDKSVEQEDKTWPIFAQGRETVTDEYERTLYAILGTMIRTPRDNPRYRLGVTFATGSAHKVRYVFRGLLGETKYNLVKYDDETEGSLDDEDLPDTYELALPFEFGVGASAEALPGLTLAGSLHFAEWSQSEYKTEDDSQFRASTAFETQYRDVQRYHLGVEYRVPVVSLDLRAGYYTDPVPFVGPRYLDPDPSTSDPPIRLVEDRRFITLGAGLLIDEVVQMDMAYVRGAFKQVEEYSGNVLSEDYAINRLVVGVGYNF